MFVPKKRLRLGIRCMASTASVIVVGSITIEGGPKGKKKRAQTLFRALSSVISGKK